MHLGKVTPFLCFDGNAEEAVNFYVDVFPDGEITQVTRYTELGPGPADSVMTISFRLNGQDYTALNGGPALQFNEAVSFMVNCDDQEEVDYYWDRLVEGGTPMACGWLKDRFGLAWQIVPTRFFELIGGDEKTRTTRVLAAMQLQVKFDLEALEAAYYDEEEEE